MDHCKITGLLFILILGSGFSSSLTAQTKSTVELTFDIRLEPADFLLLNLMRNKNHEYLDTIKFEAADTLTHIFNTYLCFLNFHNNPDSNRIAIVLRKDDSSARGISGSYVLECTASTNPIASYFIPFLKQSEWPAINSLSALRAQLANKVGTHLFGKHEDILESLNLYKIALTNSPEYDSMSTQWITPFNEYDLSTDTDELEIEIRVTYKMPSGDVPSPFRADYASTFQDQNKPQFMGRILAGRLSPIPTTHPIMHHSIYLTRYVWRKVVMDQLNTPSDITSSLD